jgi:Sulfotransferase domain
MTAVQRKIFNIGFHKTGTTSLTWFMHEYGFRTLHNTAYSMDRLNLGSQQQVGADDGIPADLATLVDPGLLSGLVREFDFFSDNPWPLLYRQLDNHFPGSRFIFTRRDDTSWLNSILKYTGSQRTRMRQLIYGYGNPAGHGDAYREIYRRHNTNVLEYFRNRKDLLVIDIESDNRKIAGDLERFLDLESRGVLFPAANTGST